MPSGLGYTFSPAGQNKFADPRRQQGGPAGSSPQRMGSALRVLSLRLPRVMGGSPISPDQLLKAPGGAGPDNYLGSAPPGPAAPTAPSTPMVPDSPMGTLIKKTIGSSGGSIAPKVKKPAAPAARKRRTRVGGGVPTVASNPTPRVIPGIDDTASMMGSPGITTPISREWDQPISQYDPASIMEAAQQEQGGFNPPREGWPDKYQYSPEMFNSFIY